MAEESHYKDWPNAGAFNALGDQRQEKQLQVEGRFPDYVAGTLYRTGPGGYKVDRNDPKDGQMACSHWFDGFTTVHKFDLRQSPGKGIDVWYSSRCQVDEQIESARRTGRLEGITFGQKRDPCDSLYRKFKTMFESHMDERPNHANIGVTVRKLLPNEAPSMKQTQDSSSTQKVLSATSDSCSSKQFDAATLEPLGVTLQDKLHPSLTGHLSASHAAEDPETGDIFNYNLAFGPRGATYRIFRASASTSQVEILAEISDRDVKGAYIHSFFMTQNFVVLCVFSSHFARGGVSVLWEQNLLDAMVPFDNKNNAIWLVVDRRKGRGLVKKFTSPAFFAFHCVNAWEKQKSNEKETVDLVCELVEFDNLDILHRFYYSNLVSDRVTEATRKDNVRKGMAARLARYRLYDVPLSGKFIKPSTETAQRFLTIETPKAGDLPRINPAYVMKPHRYVWSVLDRGKSSFLDGLGKTDVETGECLVWECGKHTPGEPVFIPAPDAEGEDHGVVLSVIFNGETGTSYLLCLDARTMKEVARADVERAVGLGFHGTHIATS